jgi:uncharacterized membrane protein YagU involved in acid resistance
MKTKIQKSVIGGIAGTAVMTLIMFIAPMMGMPKMNPATMLSGMLGVSVFVGWIMHFMIGIVFALSYVFIFSGLLKKITTDVINGALFGLIIFVFAQIMMMLMKIIMGGMPSPEGSMTLMMIGSIMGHIVYGIVTVLIVRVRAKS